MVPRPIARSSRPHEHGSLLLIVALVILFFISASVPLAQAQYMHARRLMADYGKMEAVYAAESGVYAVFDTRQDYSSAPVIVIATPETTTRFLAKLQPSGWIESTGSAVVQGDTYVATARGYLSGNRIAMWEFGP